MKVIVIIVTYNGKQWYQKCFDSLRNSLTPLDTIVIDNNSSDDTVSFIKQNYPEIHLVENKTNLGFGGANNIGFKYAIEQDADYVFLLNQDAWIESNTISGLIDIHKKDSKYGVLTPMQLNGEGNHVDLGVVHQIEHTHCPSLISDLVASRANKALVKDVYPISFANAASWLISKECFLRVGGFDPIFFHYGEDVNYLHRVHYHKFVVGICPSLYLYHDRGNRKSENNFSRKRRMDSIFLLTQIVNINESAGLMFYRLLIQQFSQFIFHLFRFKIKEAAICMAAIFSITIKLPKIMRHRKLELNKGIYIK